MDKCTNNLPEKLINNLGHNNSQVNIKSIDFTNLKVYKVKKIK